MSLKIPNYFNKLKFNFKICKNFHRFKTKIILF